MKNFEYTVLRTDEEEAEMIRKIIHIDEEKCNGCGLCAEACHEGVIDMVDGKAKLVRENFCDGFGDCLPNCLRGGVCGDGHGAHTGRYAGLRGGSAPASTGAAGIKIGRAHV